MQNAFSPVPLVLFGVPFHNVTFEEAIQWTIDRVHSGKPGVIATANLDFLVLAQTDEELRNVLYEADLVIADGFPPVKLAPFFGPPLKGRVTGSDITPMLAERAEKEGISVYGLGAADGVAAKAMAVLKDCYPDLNAAGAWSPPYGSLETMDHSEILRRLAEAKPDILFTAFGAPKQDKFNMMHRGEWNVPVSIGIGGTLDFIAGVQTRAPVWAQKIQCEWLWRWGTNPKRFTKRYASNILFLMRAIGLTLRLRWLKNIPAPIDPSAPPDWAEQCITYHEFQGLEKLMKLDDKKIVVDLREVEQLDSQEIGGLLELTKRGTRVVLLHAGSKVRKLWDFSKLNGRFPLAATCSEALEILGK
jgi:N-acetylglucosaminyldiphosphoundecaprenol N-acetyl-beta-D-mannosaminyltransferase